MSQRLSVISSYLLSGPVSPDSVSIRVGLGVAGACFLIGIIAVLFSYRVPAFRNSLIRKLALAARWGGGLMLILLFLEQQDIEPFDMRLWPALIALPLIGYCLFSVVTYRKAIPILIKENVRRERYEKYLPTKKKK